MPITHTPSRGRATTLFVTGVVVAAVVAVVAAIAAPAEAASEPEMAAASAERHPNDAAPSPIMLPLVLCSILLAARAAPPAAGDRRG